MKPDFDVIYKEIDDIKISTDIYLPQNREGKRPVSKSPSHGLLYEGAPSNKKQ